MVTAVSDLTHFDRVLDYITAFNKTGVIAYSGVCAVREQAAVSASLWSISSFPGSHLELFYQVLDQRKGL